MANMNVFIHNMEAEIALGDTMNLPKFLDERGGLRKFDMLFLTPCGTRIFKKAHMKMTPLVGLLSAFLRPARLTGLGSAHVCFTQGERKNGSGSRYRLSFSRFRH